MHMEKVLPDPRAAQVALALSHCGRATIEQTIELLIEQLDASDGDTDAEPDENDRGAEEGGEGGSWPEVGDGKQHDALHAYDDDEREEDAHAPVERQSHRDRIRATRCRRTSNVYYPFALPASPRPANFGRRA